MLKTKLILMTPHGTWVKTSTLPFAPFPGLGIRLDVYDMVNVLSVVVGDARCDVTCIVRRGTGDADEAWAHRLGFEEGTYP